MYEHTVNVILHGKLKTMYPDKIRLSGSSVAEIIRGLCNLIPAFRTPPDEPKLLIKIKDFYHKETLYAPIPPTLKDLHIMPEMIGGKNGGTIQIGIAVVLIAISFYLGGPGAAAGTAQIVANVLFNVGVALALGGLLQLLSPSPQSNSVNSSKYLGATGNTTAIGTRIPILYGRMQVYGQYISFNVEPIDVAPDSVLLT